MIRSLSILFLILTASQTEAYPQFIGHGYTSCLTCHFSPTGGGALNDYGRALYAVEVSRKPFWSDKTDDQLGEEAGFLGKKPLPYWIRPGIKYRRLVQEINPGSSNKIEGDYRMQLDLNLNIFSDDTQTKGLITTLSHLHRPRAALPNRPISKDMENFAMREYFWRQQIGEMHWVSVGFMDKPFGIKHADHTATNRVTLPLAQNDQVHGVQYSRFGQKTEFHIMAFAGNLHLGGEEQRAGGSWMFEYEPVEKMRYGFSGFYQEDPIDAITGFSVHTKIGLLDHNAWLFEIGSRKQKEWTPFIFSQLSMNLTRGVYLEPTFQFTQSELHDSGTQTTKAGLGVLYFPFQRLELRAQAINVGTKQQGRIGSESWVAQLQLHLSL